MIGQKVLTKYIESLEELPRFIILHGAAGSEKREVSEYIAKKLKSQIVFPGIKVDDVREVINTSYKVTMPTVYVFENSDKMSISAKNSLLKVTEEPPQRAYFILYTEDLSKVLKTLVSRGTVFTMDLYSTKEIEQYALLKDSELIDTDLDIIKGVCNTPGEVDTLLEYDPISFYNYCNLVVANILHVSGPNAFKIGQKLKLKDEDKDKYDLKLFFKTIQFLFLERFIKDNNSIYGKCIEITSKYMRDLDINGINKSSTVDMWILELRGIEL